MAKNDGGPAFPQNDLSAYGMGPSETSNSGMTAREWFAGQALPGVMALCAKDTRNPNETIEEMFSRKSYAIADAMIAARDQ